MSLTPTWDGAGVAEDSGLRSDWDTVFLGADVLPGVAQVTGLVRRKLDVKHAPGSSGATIADLGVEPARFEIIVTLWTTKQMSEWSSISQQFSPWGAAKAFDIGHPSLTLAGISRAYVESVSLLVPGQEPGTFTTRISCIEWVPKPTRVGVRTPTESRSSASLTSVRTVLDSPSSSGAADP